MNKLYIVVAYDYDDIPTNMAVFFSKDEANIFIDHSGLSIYKYKVIQEATYTKNGMWEFTDVIEKVW